MKKADDQKFAHLRTLEEVKDEHIKLVLSETQGNKMQAARILGIDRRTLYRFQAAAARRQ